MKTKILLFVSLVLIVVQGWASPVDSLTTNATGLIPNGGIFDVTQQVTNQTYSVNSMGTLTPLSTLNTQNIHIDETLSFGTTTVGTTKTKQIQLITCSSDPNFISVIVPDQNHVFSIEYYISKREQKDYYIAPPQGSIGPGEWRHYYEYTWNINVIYSPTKSGSHKTVISLKKVNTYFDPIYQVLYSETSRKFYELSGCAVNPTLTVDKTSLNFGNVLKGKTTNKTLTVKGTYLTGNLALSTNSSSFTVSPTTITAAEAAAGKTVTVTYSPTATGTHSATLTISGGGAKNKCVNLSGKCIDNQSITVNPSSYNFGTVTMGNQMSKTFTVTGTNLNSRISVVTQMETTGGEYTISPTDLPATGGTVTVTFKPLSAGGSGATFTFSNGEASARIAVEGTCVNPTTPKISTNVSSLAFGTVVKGNTASKSFTVTGTDLTGSLTLSSNSSYFTVSPTTITAAQAAAGKTVTVTYKPTAAGTHNASVTISGGGASPKTISVSGTCVDPKINISVSNLNFGTVVKGNSASKSFTVTSTYLTGNLAVSSNSSNFTVSPTTLPASGGTVTVTYKPTATGSHSGTITISGGEGATSTTVSLTVTGQCVIPNIIPSISTISFGTVVKGNTASKSFTVTGTDLTGNLTLSSSNSNFTVTPTTITAANAANGVTVTVTYKPTAAGSHSGTITIKGGDAANKTVSVSGKCVVPEITTSVSSLHFAAAVSKTFKVTGTNLTGSLTVKSSNAKFTVSPSTISASDAAAGKYVTVTYHDTDGASNASGIITISGGGAPSKTVSVTYAKGQDVQINPVYPEGEGENGNDEFTNWTSHEAYQNSMTDVHELEINSKIYADGLNIIIESPVEQKAVISDIAGHIREVNLQAGRNEIPVNASGIYIVRIREKSTKLMLK